MACQQTQNESLITAAFAGVLKMLCTTIMKTKNSFYSQNSKEFYL